MDVVKLYVRERVPYWALLALCVLMAGCGPVTTNTVPRSPEAQLALKGRAVVNMARAVLPVIDSHMTLGLLPKPAGIRILQGIRLIGVEAGTMAQALAVMDAAAPDTPEYAGAAVKAQMALAAIQKALVITKAPDDPALAGEVNRLLSTLTLAVSEVAAAMEGRQR